jgi:solute carrier family 25 citrate transporter 1
MSNEKMKNIIGGSLAGTAEAIITWPFENLKTQMQFKDNQQTIIKTAVNIYKSGGLNSFYRGLSPVLFFNIPKVISRFYAYDYSKNYLQSQNITGNTNIILSGLFAGFVESTLVTVPSETIKTKMIKNPQLSIKNIIKQEGLKGLYQGYTPTLLRQSLNQASRFLFYQHYKDYIIKKYKKFSPYHSLQGGIFAGIFSVIVSTPADVIKTQMQEGKKEKMLSIIKKIYFNYGITGFWRGSLARMLRVAPGQGVMFFTYDSVSYFIDKLKYSIK